MAQIVSRLGAKGIRLGPKEAEFAAFTLHVDRPDDELQSPSVVLPFYGRNSAAQLTLAAFGAPWEGCFNLQLVDPPISRYEAWINQDKAVEYVKKWQSEMAVHGDDVSAEMVVL
jgi:hypothetical protein